MMVMTLLPRRINIIITIMSQRAAGQVAGGGARRPAAPRRRPTGAALLRGLGGARARRCAARPRATPRGRRGGSGWGRLARTGGGAVDE